MTANALHTEYELLRILPLESTGTPWYGLIYSSQLYHLFIHDPTAHMPRKVINNFFITSLYWYFLYDHLQAFHPL